MTLECPNCYGYGCKSCGDTGRWELKECGRQMVTADVWQMLAWVNRFNDHGILPCSGAGYDQTAAFMASLDFITRTENQMKAELGIHGE